MHAKATLICILLSFCVVRVLTLNNKPVIGLLCQERELNDTRGDTYLMADYVQYIHGAGAMAVPIRVKESDRYYEDMFQKINGLLLPGGSLSLTSSEYAKAGIKFIRLALDAKKRGDYFPMWGTCLGSELLIQTIVGSQTVYSNCYAEDLQLPLHLLPGGKESRLLQHMSDDVVYALTHENVTANYHRKCLQPKVFEKNEKLKAFCRPISTNYDVNGTEFISLYEAKDYPIYGSQFHPEKNIYLWTPIKHLDRGLGAIEVSQYFANFFVNEARKSNHRYPDNETLSKDLIYNYNPVYLGFPSMQSNYYFNYTTEDDQKFEDRWKKSEDGDLFSMWKREEMNTIYILCSIVIFFVMGISFVFVMDYAITISGKLFNFTRKTSDENIYIEHNDDVTEKLLKNEPDVEKVPFKDGPDM